MKHLVFFFLIVMLSASWTGHENTKTLFFIERNKDKNQIHYLTLVNQKDQVIAQDPINIHWRKSDGHIESLSWMQRQYAYGIKTIKNTLLFTQFQFVSYNKIDFFLLKNKAIVIVNYKHKTLQLKRIFVHFKNNDFWHPQVKQVDLIGNDTIHALPLTFQIPISQ